MKEDYTEQERKEVFKDMAEWKVWVISFAILFSVALVIHVLTN